MKKDKYSLPGMSPGMAGGVRDPSSMYANHMNGYAAMNGYHSMMSADPNSAYHHQMGQLGKPAIFSLLDL